MTFFIPPVFLFGNKVRHNQEEMKAEYKTATETEIQIENRNIKRIAELEEENKTLKDNVEFLHSCLDDRDKSIAIMQEENKKLNIKVASLEGEIKGLNSVIEKLREELSAYDREYFDEDKKAKNIFMEEDTLQELRDLGKI